MDYKLIYDALIRKAKNRTINDYFEMHHIIPRCKGGTDEMLNLVKLTPEEHYTAHLLLTKIYPYDISLVMASMMMCAKRKSNKVYGWLRRKHAIAMSKSQSGLGNSGYGTKWIICEQTLEVKRVNKNEPIPNGWKSGRKIVQLPNCNYCGNKFTPGNGHLKYCSDRCKCSANTDTFNVIDENIDAMISMFIETKSISKTLSNFGFQKRTGNKYLAEQIRKRGYGFLIRASKA